MYAFPVFEAVASQMVAGWAHDAYDGYGDDAGWMSHQGDVMPRWYQLPARTRRHWFAAIARIMGWSGAIPEDPMGLEDEK